MKVCFDHVVIGASRLAQDTRKVERQLGATTGGGGAHPLMATHNRLMRLGESSGYLEVIAVDPTAPPPSRRRWYTLDDQHTTERLSLRPRALCWVASVDDIEAATRACGYDAGEIIEVTRGDLRWRLTVPDDGGLAGDGILPALIEWPDGINPVASLPAQDVRLAGITATHPDPNSIMTCLERLGLAGLVTLTSGPALIAFDFTTETGIVRID